MYDWTAFDIFLPPDIQHEQIWGLISVGTLSTQLTESHGSAYLCDDVVDLVNDFPETFCPF